MTDPCVFADVLRRSQVAVLLLTGGPQRSELMDGFDPMEGSFADAPTPGAPIAADEDVLPRKHAFPDSVCIPAPRRAASGAHRL